MFKHILVPVDGSATARRAIDKAIAVAQAFDSTVTLIYVIDPYPFSSTGSVPSYAQITHGQAEYLSAANAEGHKAIGAARQVFDSHGISVAGSVIEDQPVYQAILDTAEFLDADLVVMGSHGCRALEKQLVLGSVTAQVLSHAHLSVLVVRE